jgi:hypothetical protein
MSVYLTNICALSLFKVPDLFSNDISKESMTFARKINSRRYISGAGRNPRQICSVLRLAFFHSYQIKSIRVLRMIGDVLRGSKDQNRANPLDDSVGLFLLSAAFPLDWFDTTLFYHLDDPFNCF